MSKVLIIGGAVAAAYWAYSKGKFPAFAPVAAAIDPVIDRVQQFLPEEFWGTKDPAKDKEAQDIKDASGGQIVPILGDDEVITTNAYEAMLRAHSGDLSRWARANISWVAAVCRVENSGMNPTTRGDGGKAHGVMQVHVPTAETCYRAGYTRYNPTAAVLETVAGGIYFGCAELDRLSKIKSDRAWIIKAYNGGAAWEGQSATYQRDREAYYDRVQSAFVALYTGELV